MNIVKLLILGLLIFFGTHLYSTLRTRELGVTIIDRLGLPTYMISYILLSAIGLGLISMGYYSAPQSGIAYDIPLEDRPLAISAMAFASIFIAAAYAPSNHIARALRHPMLAGVIVWAAAHLISGNEIRDLLTFGSFLIFAVINIFVVNRRSSERPKTMAQPQLRGDLIAIGAGLSAYAIFASWLHAELFGVAIW